MDSKQYKTWGVPPPTSQPHGTPDEIKANLEQVRPTKWRMEGNKLIGESEYGEVVQFLPTNIVCDGSDKEGLPILREIGQTKQ